MTELEGDRPCTRHAYDLVWASQDADAAMITDPDGTTAPVETTGTAQRCVDAARNRVFALEVTGPGGTDTRSVTASPQ